MPHRHAVVTGGTRGIGAAISRRIAADGWHVSAIYRSDAAQAESFAQSAKSEALDISVHRADIATVQACQDVAAAITVAHGPVTALVNNAGVLVEARVPDLTEADWDVAQDVNLKAAFFLSQAVWPAMVEAGRGRIVNVGSVTAAAGNPVEAAYGAAKAGLEGLTRSLAMAGARKGITVNCVTPGVFETDMTNAMDEKAQAHIAAMIPLGRRGRPEEFAHLVHALVQDDASYVTGSIIAVNGGLGMGA